MKLKKFRAALTFLLCVCALCGAVRLPAGAAPEYPTEVLVGGVPFGVRFFTDGVFIVGYCDVKTDAGDKNPAKDAGLAPGDCILEADGKALESAGDLAARIETCGEAPLRLTFRRGGEKKDVTLTPAKCAEDGRHRMGLLVRDSGAGIGTVTYVLENSGAFGGLGHGICEGGTEEPMPLARGSVLGVTVSSVNKGAVGAPGELRGHFSAGKTGALLCNTPCGVFGVFAEPPEKLGQKLPVGHRDQVHNGAASVRCTLDDNQPREYAIEISAVNRSAEGNKCFTVKVTDEALLARTGGIVQGMSGSPVIQDGRLIGAVTHVLIGDPTTGYGIFLDNMLSAMPENLR